MARVAHRGRTILCAGIGTLLFVAAASGGVNGAEDNSPVVTPPETTNTICVAQPTIQVKPDVQIVAEAPPDPWTEDELEAIVQTLAGECYDDMVQDKRLVCEVILNRASTAGFPDTVVDVLSYPNAFNGYWVQYREASENDYEVASQALRDWYDNDCQPLSNYLFFSAGENRENVFREEY